MEVKVLKNVKNFYIYCNYTAFLIKLGKSDIKNKSFYI